MNSLLKPAIRLAIGLLVLLLFSSLSASAQATADRQLKVVFGDAVEGKPLEIRISSPVGAQVDRAVVRYKNFGISEYRFIEAQPQGNDFVGTIPANYVIAPSIDFYVVAVLRDNTQVTFPFLTPIQTPANITVRPLPEDPNLVVISPSKDETVRPEDAVISFSYYTISEKVSKEKSQLFVDGKDVTKKAIFSENLVTYIPDEPPKPGPLRAEFIARDARGVELGRTSTFFRVSAAPKSTLDEAKRESQLTYNTQSWVETRQENVGDTSIFYARGNLNAEMVYNDWLRVGTNIYVTNEEDKLRQPANRFLFKVNTDYFDVQVGDIFPDYNFYLSNGVRVRGYELSAKLAGMRFATTQGDAAREIQPQFGATRVISITQPDSIVQAELEGFILVDSTNTTKTYKQLLAPGAFRRNYFTAVGGFFSKVFRLELQYLKVKDQINETRLDARGVRPEESVGFGSSLRITPVPNVFDLYGDIAVGGFNSDITGGSLSAGQVAQLLGKKGQDSVNFVNDLERFPGGYERLRNFITVNPNLAFPTPLGSATAWRTGTTLNNNFGSWGNFFKVEYVRQGANFRSLGLAFYQPDIAGIRINDRLRLLNSRLLLSFGYESLTDNLNEQRNIETQLGQTIDGTTTRNLLSLGASVFPGINLPSVRLEYRRQSNVNEIPASYRDSIRIDNVTPAFVGSRSALGTQIDNVTNTFNFDVQQTFNLKNSKTLQLGFNTVFSNRDENRDLSALNTTFDTTRNTAILLGNIYFSPSELLSVTSQKFSSRTISLNGTLTFANSLRINGGISNQSSEFVTGVFLDTNAALGKVTRRESLVAQTFNSLDAGVGYGFLNNTLRPTVRTSITFGDFSRTLVGVSTIYDITPTQNLTADLNFFIVGEKEANGVKVASSTDIIASVRYQILLGN
ncbi:MAG: hypothetical protein SNJ55_00900 [Chloroherpetonaceae bacterium]